MFAGDDEIKGLPESALTKFLKVLKQDSMRKQVYLNQLRITPKFIKACSCSSSHSANRVHSYCMTAHVIQTRKIYCTRCDDYYKLFLRQQNLNIIGSVLFYIFMIVNVIALSMSICVLDGYIKCKTRIERENLSFSSEIAANLGIISFV